MPSSSSCLLAVSALRHCFQHGLFLLPSQEAAVGGMPGRRVFPASAMQGAGSEGHPNPAVSHDSVLSEPVCKGGALGLLGVCAQRLKMSSSGVIIRFGFLNTHLLSLPCFQRQRSSHSFSGLHTLWAPPACRGQDQLLRQPQAAYLCDQLHSENSPQGQFLEWFRSLSLYPPNDIGGRGHVWQNAWGR